MSSNPRTGIALTGWKDTESRNLAKDPAGRNKALSAAIDVVLALHTVVQIVKETWDRKPNNK